MLINYTIFGNIDVNGNSVACTYVVKNITTGYVSNPKSSLIGYYSFNLIDFPNVEFNHNDIVVIEFSTRYNGIDYFNTLYHVISTTNTDTQLNSTLLSNWNFTSDILLNITGNVVDVTFFTSYYNKIMYKLFINYNNTYKELDTVTLSIQNITLTLNGSGDYKIIGYVIDRDRLLTVSEKTFTISNSVTVTNTNKRYIEWE